MQRIILVIGLLILCSIPLRIRAQTIEVHRVSPLGLVPGKTNEVTFTGQNVESATMLWSSFPTSWAKLTNAPQGQARFSIWFDKSATAGIQTLQLVGPKGASDFCLVLVDPMLAQASSDKNRQFKDAEVITPPLAVDGAFKNEAADYYAFGAEAGQKLTIEIVAHRLGSATDPVVRVLDSEQRELIFVEDDALGERDSRFRFTAPHRGRFYLDIHDVGFQGGSRFDYRLRVGSFPLFSFSYPLGVQKRRESRVELLGPGGLEAGAVSVPPQRGDLARVFLALSNSFAPVLVDSLPELTESEPNNSVGGANPVSVPAIWNGRFDSASDIDTFAFEAAKDERIAFRGETRSAGVPCDLVLKLTAANGQVLAESNPSDPGEGGITNLFQQSGRYYLHVSELTGQHGPAMVYRLIVEESPALFGLNSESERLAISPGGSATIKLGVTRSGYDGPIEVRIDGLDGSFSMESAAIEKGKKEFDLKITASASAKPGDFFHFKLSGRATEPLGSPVFVSTKPALRKDFPALLHPPPELDGLFTLTVTGEKSTSTAQK